MSLDSIRRIYAAWGRPADLYTAQDLVTFLGQPQLLRRRAVAALRLEPGACVLEVGCGTGRNFPYILEAIGPGGQLVGFDYSAEMLDAAGRLCADRGWENVRLVQGDAAVLDVGEGSFDGILSILAMSVIPDYRSALCRCRELLRPGGTIAVCDARPFSGSLSLFNPLVRALYVPLTGWDPDRPVPEEMETVFGNVKLAVYNFGSLYIATSVRR